MVIFLRSNDLTSDSRARKYLDYYRETGVDFMVICWNRSEIDVTYPSNYIVYTKQVAYNLGKKAILSRISWNIFIFRKIFQYRKKCRIIHACDFDTILPVLPFALAGKITIFDIFDMFSYTIQTNVVVDWLIGMLENISVKISRYVIICEKERINQIRPFFRNPSTYVLPNIPVEQTDDLTEINIDRITGKENEGQLILSYVGAFYQGRFLKEIIQTVAGLDNVILIMAGYGDREIEEDCRYYAATNSNIRYLGRVDYSSALSIMRHSDLLIGLYCLTNRNHFFAAPNKFYESLMLKKPLITSKGTAVGDKVTRYDTGFTIHESKDEFLSLLLRLHKEPSLISTKSINCGIIWEREFKNYIPDFFSTTYAKMINTGTNK